jgi:Cap4 SAVED domain
LADARTTAFDKLLDPIAGMDNVLKEVTADPALRLPRLVYLRMQGDKPQLPQLAELLTSLLVDYALPLTKRRQANAAGVASPSGGTTAAHLRLLREAQRLLVKFTEEHRARYGELGELLSYAIAVHYLRAPQLGSKMALKTNSNMPVHGVDGLHVRPNANGTVTFFILESKIVPNATDASRAMMESIAGYQDDRNKLLNELRLVTDMSNLDALEGAQREEAKSYFDAYSTTGNHLKRRDMYLGSLVISEEAYQDKPAHDPNAIHDAHEQHLESLYKAKHPRFRDNLANQAKAKSVNLNECEVFLIAVPDVDELKRAFAALNQ